MREKTEPFFGSMDEREYRERQRKGSIGGSALSTIYHKSAAHYMEQRGKAPSAAMLFGTAVHTMILEPREWRQRYFTGRAVQRLTFEEPIKTDHGWDLGDGSPPFKTKKGALAAIGADRPWTITGCKGSWRTKKEADAALEELAEGRQILTIEDELKLAEVVQAIWSHPIAGAMLQPEEHNEIGYFKAEDALLWFDEIEHAECSGKIDGVLAPETDWRCHGLTLRCDEVIGIDLKTTGKPVAPHGFARRCIESGWHMQAAHYIAGAAASGMKIDRWINIVVETGRPNGVRVVELSKDMLRLGQVHRAKALDKWRQYQERKPGDGAYDPDALLIEPPAWAMQDLDDWSSWGGE